MGDKEKLHDTFGELLYAVAMADGVIQEAEENAMKEVLKDHPWAEQINWSFTYEKNKTTSVHTAYAKAINFCKSHGPSPYYDEFIEAMNKIAEAARGGDEKEGGVINSFSKDLIEQFQHDLDKVK